MALQTPEQLRKLSQKFREAGRKIEDIVIKRLFAEEALTLAMEAEALERKDVVN